MLTLDLSVEERATRDPAFAQAMLADAAPTFLNGESEVG